MKFFISYSSRDADFSNELAGWLEERGHDVWMDKRKIFGGANYFNKIAEGIRGADIIITVLSSDSISSDWLGREIYYSVENRKSIIPVLAHFTEIPDALKLALAGLHSVDFTLKLRVSDPWIELEQAIAAFKSIQGDASEGENTETSSYKNLNEYVSANLKRRRSLRRITVSAIVSVLIIVGVIIDRYFILPNLPSPETIQVKAVTTAVQDVFKLVYATPLKQDSPSASIAVMVEKAGSGLNVLKEGEELSSNDNYFFLLQPEGEAYFYIFQIDSTGKLDWLFPKNRYCIHSAGQNPLPVGKWTKIPESDKAYYLDENVGLEHFYIVATRSRWEVLEAALTKASQSGGMNQPVLAQFGLKTRGVAGERTLKIDLPLDIKQGDNQVQQLIKGKAGALVIEKWFKHVGAD